ncbi:MAG: DUF4199 domain-containing protein [Bacteroidota bacterium]|nr:DUF4199 domain-containing protein [Bacteroidota bacterium]
MRKIVLTYGLIAFGIMFLMMHVPLAFASEKYLEYGMVIGYTSMVLAFTLVFFGTRSYRDNIQHGVISFGRAFGVGILISLVASVLYVIVWMIIEHYIVPDFYEQYGRYAIESEKASGASATQLAATQSELNSMMEMVKNPVVKFLFTLLEPLPVGLLATLVTAFIVKRKAVPAIQ